MIINLLSLFSLLFLSWVSASEVLTLGTYKIPNYVKTAKEGIFIDLVQRVAKRADVKVKIEIYPPKRTVHNFFHGKLDGYFPALDVLNEKGVNKSVPFYYKKDFLFSLGKVPKKSEGNQRVCLTRGYPYNLEIIKDQFEIIQSSSDESCFKILEKKRAEAFLCELHTGIRAAENLGIDYFKVKPKVVSSLPVYFAFQANQRGLKFSRLFTAEIRKMRKSGELSKIFSSSTEKIKNYVNFGYDPTLKN